MTAADNPLSIYAILFCRFHSVQLSYHGSCHIFLQYTIGNIKAVLYLFVEGIPSFYIRSVHKRIIFLHDRAKAMSKACKEVRS